MGHRKGGLLAESITMTEAARHLTVAHDKGGWMQTYTGGVFWPLKPEQSDIRFEDISSALSKMCRYGGHCTRFYSVAEHCVHVASVVSDKHKLTALLHDASEAYLSDVIRPVKPFLQNYYEIEDRLMKAIADRFGITWPLPDEVKRADNAILADERKQNMAFMDVPAEMWGDVLPPLGVTLQFWNPHEAQYQFSTAFYRFGGRP